MDIRRISWQETIPVRHQVLWPNKPPAFCEVENDETGIHFGAVIDGTLVSVASIYIEGEQARLRKYATLQEYQEQGIGSALLQAVFAYLEQHAIRTFWCDAREETIGFYQRFGMETEGERFYKSKQPYYKMSCQLLLS